MSEVAVVLYLVVEIALLLFLLGCVVFFGSLVYSFTKTAPYVRSDRKAMAAMIRLASITPGMHVVELGSGNGELTIRASELGANALGYEINLVLVVWSRLRSKRRKMTGSVVFAHGDFWKEKLPADTDVVFAYLLPEAMPKLWEKLHADLRPGTRIISNGFVFKDRQPDEQEGDVRLYRLV
ncbi:MAG: 50S ribosomal protein L11 methyltransferase [Patescibacteria group bacterium]